MLAPEIIEKIRREREEKEEHERPALRLPLPQPDVRSPKEHVDHEEKTKRVIEIDLA